MLPGYPEIETYHPTQQASQGENAEKEVEEELFVHF
jgi:hypothetical protein